MPAQLFPRKNTVNYLPLLSSLLLGGCPAAQEASQKNVSLPSLLIITLDTTRADHIGAYGHEHAKTPTIDALAAQGYRFERAYSTIPLTTPAHASILSGLYPPRHGIRNNGDAILSEDINTIAEHLSNAGYETAAAVSAFVTTKVWNLDQGFDAYFDSVDSGEIGNRWGQERPADQVVDDLTAWIDDVEDAPFLGWAHFYDPHHPHVAPPGFETGFESIYDAEIAFVDAQISRLLSHAEAAAGKAGLAVIVVADHGEAFNGEHGESTHSLFLFDATMRIPFIVRPPIPLTTPVVDTQNTVSLVDVTPTALALIGATPMEAIDGVDVLHEERRPPVYMESVTVAQRFGYHPEIAAVHGTFKLMDTPDKRLYDVASDPNEQHNIKAEHPDTVTALSDFSKGVWNSAVTQSEGGMSPEVLAQLSMLGYVTTEFSAVNTDSTIDAKNRVETIQEIERIRNEGANTRDPVATEAAYRALLKKEPQLGEAQMGLARALAGQGKDAEAETVYREALIASPGSAVLMSNLANAVAAQGRKVEGLEIINALLEQVPGDLVGQSAALKMMSDLDLDQEAIARARGWLETVPEEPMLLAHLGILIARTGDKQEAMQMLNTSLEDGVPRQLVHRVLGAILLEQGDKHGAAVHLFQESTYFPIDASLLAQTSSLTFELQQWSETDTVYQSLERMMPLSSKQRLEWAQATFNLEDYPLSLERLQPALESAPNDADILLLHANILAKVGKREQGLEVFKRAKSLNKKRLKSASQPH